LGTIAAIMLWQFVFPFFYSMRFQWQNNKTASISTWIDVAWSETLSGAESERYTESVRNRLRALNFNYLIADRLNEQVPTLDGTLLKFALADTIPRAVFPRKLWYIYSITGTDDPLKGGPDAVVNQHLGLPGADQVSNLPAFALADFGLLGCLAYGVIFAAGVRLIQVMMKTLFRRSPLGAIAIFSGATLLPLFQMEFSPNAYFKSLRLLIIIFVAAYLWSKVFASPHTQSWDESLESDWQEEYPANQPAMYSDSPDHLGY